MPKMANTDLSKLLKSEEIRKALKAPSRKVVKAKKTKANPLKNIRAMLKLNPYAAVTKKNAELLAAKNLKAKATLVAKKTGQKLPADPLAKRNAKVIRPRSKPRRTPATQAIAMR